MQNKGLVKFIAILFALVSIYQLSFTFVTNHYENKAKEFAKGDLTKESRYLDSIANETVYLGQTFEEVRSKQVKKGLDLEGGVNVMLQISIKDVLKSLSNHSNNPVFNKALEDVEKVRGGNETYLNAFFTAFENESKGTVKLASADIFSNRNLPEVNVSMADSQVKTVLEAKVKEAVESAYIVIRERIDEYGTTSPTIQLVGDSGRILVELPGAKDIDRIKNLLQSTAQLEFWETYKIEELGDFLFAANDVLKNKYGTVKVEKDTANVVNNTSDVDKLLTGVSNDSTNVEEDNGPLFNLMLGLGQQGSPVLAYFNTADVEKVNEYLADPQVRSLLTGQNRYARFVWHKVKKGENVAQLLALKGNAANVAPISGDVVTQARDDYDQMSGRPIVSMQMNAAGAKAWEELTGKAYAQGSNIAIVLDNVVYSAPGVTTGAISGGSSSISGDFTVAETKDLANILKAGKLPASADIISSEIVGPSLGQEAIDAGTLSSIAGLLIIAAWMLFFYGKAGWYSIIALGVNILFMFAIFTGFDVVLTLPGIAGIVLTIGTAVDTNILIYERAKESLREGHTGEEAVKHAFSWSGAMSAIVDANVTTALTGVVLVIFGTGPIKGFAVTLLIGIVTSLFTAIFITRVLVDRAVRRNKDLAFTTKITKNWFTNMNFDFIGKKKASYIISSIVMIGCIASIFINGMNMGTDFVGGRTFLVKFDKPVPASDIAEDLSTAFDSNVEAKIFGNDSQIKITTKYRVEEEGVTVDKEVNEVLYTNLKKYLPADLTYEEFVNTHEGKTVGVLQASKVGPTVAKDVKTNAYWAVVGSLAIVFIYLALSFRKWQYSLGAVTAVAHDVIFVLGVYSFFYRWAPFNMEVDQSFVAALLTVIGYSLNDTVIVFDRVREFVKGKTEGTFVEVVNQSINTTLSRTFNTSATVIVVLLIMFIFGGDSLRGFVFAMLLGIGVGTYSSLFISTPILVDTARKSAERERAELLARSQEEENENKEENTELI